MLRCPTAGPLIRIKSETNEEKSKKTIISKLMLNDSKPQKIINRLYLGSVGSAYNIESLKSLNISYILTVCEDLNPRFPKEFVYKIIPISDLPSSKLHLYFQESTDFIKSAIDRGHNVLVHCFAGVSRSSSIVIAYLIRFYNMDVQEALSFIRKKRPCVCPNHGFYTQLKRLHLQLNEKNKFRYN